MAYKTGSVTTLGQMKSLADKENTLIGEVASAATDAIVEQSQNLDTHSSDKTNPHGVTAAQTGAVPLGGGTMTGILTLSGSPTADLHAATKAYVDTQTSTVIPETFTITIPASDWDSSTLKQTVSVFGISATETAQLIQPVPAISSQAMYYNCVVYCSEQSENALTFSCDKVPTADMTVYIVITDLA